MSGELHPWNVALWRSLELPQRLLPRSLLLSGPRGVGKSAFALHLAGALLCRRPGADGQACASCQSCRLYAGGNHPDFRLIQEPGSQDEAGDEEGGKGRTAGTRWIRVDQIRELGQLLALRAHLGGRRVILISPADRLHASAANALLKTLEEPPDDTHFLLVSTAPGRLPATILSRCVRLRFQLPAAADALAWLAAREGGQPALALAQAGSAPLLACDLDSVEYWSRRERLIGEVLSCPDFDPIAASEHMAADELGFLVAQLQRWCHDLLLVRAVQEVRYNPDRAQILHRLAVRLDPQRLLDVLKDLQSAARFLEHPLNVRLVAERCLIGYKRLLIEA